MTSDARASRRRETKLNGKRPAVLTIDELLFGTAHAPSEECLEERRKLVAEFRSFMAFTNARTPRMALDLLKKEWAGWDGKRPRREMSLLQDVAALRAVEQEIRKPKGVTT